MQIETIGPYQLHLFAYELPEPGGWDPFLSILRFDDIIQDFRCVLSRHHASTTPAATYDEAIDQARRVGNALIKSGNLPDQI